MNVRWLPSAERDFENRIEDLIAHNPRLGVASAEAVLASVANLADFPMIGRAAYHGTREMVVSDTPFIVVYDIRGQDLVVLRIRHAAQKWPRP